MKKFFGWKIVALAFFLDFCAVGYSFQSFPVVVLELSKEFSLSRFLATLPIPLFMIMSSLFMPFIGRVLDKGAIRSTLMAGALVYGLSLISLYFAFSYISFMLIFTLPMALGVTMMGNISVSKLISLWFRKYTGRALGIASVGVSFAGFVFPNLTISLFTSFYRFQQEKQSPRQYRGLYKGGQTRNRTRTRGFSVHCSTD